MYFGLSTVEEEETKYIATSQDKEFTATMVAECRFTKSCFSSGIKIIGGNKYECYINYIKYYISLFDGVSLVFDINDTIYMLYVKKR